MMRKFGKLGSVGNRTQVQRAISYLRKLNTSPAGINDANGFMQKPANLLLNSATPATQSVTCTAQVYTLALIGTGSVALSGTASGTLTGTGASDLVVLTFTPTAGSVTLTKSGSVTSFGLFTGTLSSAQILAMGGIPITTSAASTAEYTRANVWDFGVAQGPLAYAASHTAAEFVAAYPLWPLWQDTSGTVPACKINDPIGLCLDQPTGIVTLGPELNTSLDFTGWSPQAGWSVSSGIASAAGAGAGTNIGANKGLVSGATYEITVVCSVLTAGSWYVRCGFDTISPSVSAAGSYTFRLPRGSNSYVYVVANTGLVATFTNISVREVIGAHASQATTTKRPILSGRVNLLTATEDFNNASWAKTATGTGSVPVVTQNFALAPDGSATAARIQFNSGSGGTTSDTSYILQMYSGAAGSQKRAGFWARLNTGSSSVIYANISGLNTIATITDSWSFYTISSQDGSTTSFSFRLGLRGLFTPTQTLDLLVWHPDLRPANSPTNIPAYQRVTSATDYDTVGFPVRALFDGVDDCLVVPSLDLSMTDKVTFVAGVTKLSDVAQMVICELGVAQTNTGALSVNSSGDSTVNSYFIQVGSASGANGKTVATGYTAPISNVISVTASVVSGTVPMPRINGAIPAQSSQTAMGTGPSRFLASTFNIGGRNNSATLPFNGAIQSLAVIGNLLPDGEVQILEASANAAMGKVY